LFLGLVLPSKALPGSCLDCLSVFSCPVKLKTEQSRVVFKSGPVCAVKRELSLEDSELWAASDELACPPDDIRPVVEEMVRLARTATSSVRSLYI